MINIGNYYDKTSDWQQAKWLELLDLAKQSNLNFQSIQTILDLGCGSGNRTLQLTNHFPNAKKILGIDSNPSMIETASSINKDPKITYLQSDIMEPCFADIGSFDLIVANYSLNWVRDKDKALKKLKQIIHKKTIFFIFT